MLHQKQALLGSSAPLLLKLVVQVNGKVRGTIEVPADTSKEAIIEAGRTNEKVIRHLEGKEIRREIYVPGRLINIVVG